MKEGIKKKPEQGAQGHAKIRRGMELKREQWEAAEGRGEGYSTGLGVEGEGKMKGSGLTEDGKKARRDGQRWETGDLNSKQGNQVEEGERKRAQETSRHW